MKKTRWRKWWIVGDISSVCNADLLRLSPFEIHHNVHFNQEPVTEVTDS
jgi:hypothetical protein